MGYLLLMNRQKVTIAIATCLIANLWALCFASTIKGVSPSDIQELKYSNTEFDCKDGSKTIPLSQVNDNFCDCVTDGSDEPATSACDKGIYYCENKGYIGKKIFSSQVEDGICDCCDGSDEYPQIDTSSTKPITQCQDTCKQEAQIAMAHHVEEYNRQKEGLKIKQEYITKASSEINSKKFRLVTIEGELEVKKAEKKVEEKRKDEAEAVQELKRVEIEARKEEELKLQQEQLPPVTQKTEDSQSFEMQEQPAGEPSQKETKQVEEEINVNGEPKTESDSEGDSESESEVDDESEEEIEEDEDEEAEEREKEEISDPELAPLIEVVNQLRDRVSQLQNEIEELEKEKVEINSLLNSDFGDNQEYYSLKGQCFSANTNEYTYEMCVFDNVQQKSKHGGGHTSLGRWEGNSDMIFKDSQHKTMKYTSGQKCWGGPDRSATIAVFCDKENRLDDPAEPNKCEYTLKFYTPAACSDQQLKQLHQQLKDYGFVHDEL